MRTTLLALAAVASAPLALGKYVEVFQVRLRGEQWCLQPQASAKVNGTLVAARNGTLLEYAKCESTPSLGNGQLWRWQGDQLVLAGAEDNCLTVVNADTPVLAACDSGVQSKTASLGGDVTDASNLTASTEWTYPSANRSLLCASPRACLSSIYAGDDKPPTLFVSWKQRGAPFELVRIIGKQGGFGPFGRLGTLNQGNQDSQASQGHQSKQSNHSAHDTHPFGPYGRLGTLNQGGPKHPPRIDQIDGLNKQVHQNGGDDSNSSTVDDDTVVDENDASDDGENGE